MSNYVKQAFTFFKQGDYQSAKKYYGLAAKEYGKDLFSVNLLLCDQYLNGGRNKVNVKSQVESLEIKNLNKEIAHLKQIIKEKDVNISERFTELAILTRMLEERDAKI